MTRGSLLRFGVLGLVGLALPMALAGCGSGGGGGGGGGPMSLVEFLFVDETLTPSFPTGTQDLPKNARLIFKFSTLVDPSSVNEQTIQIRKEPVFQTVPEGSFQVDGNIVIFDPTITKTGQPNPFGFDSFSQYSVYLPSVEDRESDPETQVVMSASGGPLLASFLTKFKTGGGYLRELNPPEVLEVFFIPDQDPVTRQVPGNGFLGIRFSEAMDPASFVVSTSDPLAPGETIDIRYTCEDPFNQANGVQCRPIPMNTPTHNPAADTYFFRPVFSFGSKKYKFHVGVGQEVTDLAGNLLVNPRSFGPFTVDGTGRIEGDVLVETFANQTDNDIGVTDADWGSTEQGFLLGAAITSRRAFVTGWQQVEAYKSSDQFGRYFALIDPLVGADLNQVAPNISPPTSEGRRVMWAYSDTEIGQDGTITSIGWGPDSNATFAAKYPTLIMRIGFQRTASMNLASTFSGNYLGSPVVTYQGEYDVVQRANVGNEAASAPPDVAPADGTPDPAPRTQLQPLYTYYGYTNWPAPTSFFDWNEGDPAVEDRVLVVDASVEEGDSWQQFRGWYAFTNESMLALIGGYPNRRLLSTFEGNDTNPQPATTPFVVLNPEPTVQDHAFTLTKRVSIAQSRFYTPGASDGGGNSYPPPYSNGKTRGVKSDYLDVVITPSVQVGGANVLAEFQGAMGLETGSARTRINVALPFTDWTTDIDDIDGFPYIRWRLTLTSNLNSNTVARVASVSVPLVSFP